MAKRKKQPVAAPVVSNLEICASRYVQLVRMQKLRSEIDAQISSLLLVGADKAAELAVLESSVKVAAPSNATDG